jgi:hypothetical protein
VAVVVVLHRLEPQVIRERVRAVREAMELLLL